MSDDRIIADLKTPSSSFDLGFVTDVGKIREMNQDFLAVSLLSQMAWGGTVVEK